MPDTPAATTVDNFKADVQPVFDPTVNRTEAEISTIVADAFRKHFFTNIHSTAAGLLFKHHNPSSPINQFLAKNNHVASHVITLPDGTLYDCIRHY